ADGIAGVGLRAEYSNHVDPEAFQDRLLHFGEELDQVHHLGGCANAEIPFQPMISRGRNPRLPCCTEVNGDAIRLLVMESFEHAFTGGHFEISPCFIDYANE